MTLARAELESLLHAHRLGATLPAATWESAARLDTSERAVVTGYVEIDSWLGGGIPRGHLSEIVGGRSTGRTSLLCALLAAATQRGELVAWIDTLDMLDPESSASNGIDLSRLLWIRGTAGHNQGVLIAAALRRALKALGLVLQAGGFDVVALDLADVPDEALRRLPHTTWLRIARLIEGSKTACLLLGAGSLARSAGGVSIVMEPGETETQRSGRWRGGSRRARLLWGLDVRARIAAAKWLAIGASRPVWMRSREIESLDPVATGSD